MNRADLRLRIRQQADMVYSSFVDDTTELNPWIDSATEDLYDFLVARFGDARFARNAWINVRNDWAEGAGQVTDPTIAWPNNVQSCTVVDGTNEDLIPFASITPSPGNGIASGYVLPADFKRLVRMHFTPGYVAQIFCGEGAGAVPIWNLVTTGDGILRPMRPMDLSGSVLDTRQRSWLEAEPEYRLLHGPTDVVLGTIAIATHHWTTSTIAQFLPLPAAKYAVQLFYVPKARLLADDTANLGYDFPEWIILDCAAQCLEKQQQDSRTLRGRLEQLKNRIQNDARTIDAANPKMVSMSGAYHPQSGSRNRMPPWR